MGKSRGSLLLATLLLVTHLTTSEARCSAPSITNSELQVRDRSCIISNNVYAGSDEMPNCDFRLFCKPHYYTNNRDNGQYGYRVYCMGGVWRISATPYASAISANEFSCNRGCMALMDVELRNATILPGFPQYTQSSATFVNGVNGKAEVVYPIGTVLHTQCKPNYIFSESRNLKKPDGSIHDNYICKGGTEGPGTPWFDQDGITNSNAGGAKPAMCNPVCMPIKESELQPLNVIIKDQEVVTVAGQLVAPPNSYHDLECKPGFKYSDGSTVQTLVCAGGPGGFVDPQSRTKAQIKPCIANGCPRISEANVDANMMVQHTCQGSQAFPVGCQVNLKCKPNYYLPEKPNGVPLECRDSGWIDPTTNKQYPMQTGMIDEKCVPGCRVPTSLEAPNVQVVVDTSPSSVQRNGDERIYSDGTVIKTTCATGFGRPDQVGKPGSESTKYFTCKDKGWIPSDNNGAGPTNPYECVPLCGPVDPAAPHTVYTNAPTGSAAAAHKMVISCEEGYELPKSVPYPDGKQTLECKGGPQQWFDPTTGNNNAKPAQCVMSGAPGCEPITDAHNNVEYDPASCQAENGLHKKGCTVTVKCKDGYVPKGGENVPDGGQKLTCEAGLNGWKNQNSGKTNENPLQCTPVCQLPDLSTKRAVVTLPPENQLVTVGNQKFAQDKAQLSIKCKSGFAPSFTGTVFNPDQTQQYECVAELRKWRRMDVPNQIPVTTPDEACVGLCDPIFPNSLTDELMNKEAEIVTVAETPEIVNKVFENQETGVYELVCKEGYKYPDGSAQAKQGGQTLICLGGDDQYFDPAENKSRATVIPCDRGSIPGCVKPENVEVKSQSAQCKFENNRFSVGCKGTFECAPGTFDPNTGEKGSVEVECKDDGRESSWVTPNGQKAAPPTCKPGCSGAQINPNVEFVNPSDQKKFYDKLETVKVRCKAGSYPLGRHAFDPREPADYQCMGTPEDLPWNNQQTSVATNELGGACIRPCKSPTGIPPSVQQQSYPPKVNVKGWDGQYVAVSSPTMKFKCISGYVYPDDSPLASGGLQDLKCDLVTGEWTDLTDNNKSPATVVECESEGKGCPALEKVNAEETQANCKNGQDNTDGCQATLKCKAGTGATLFVTANDETELKLECKDNKNWVDSSGKIYTGKGLNCQPVCNTNRVSNTSNIVTTLTMNYIRPHDAVDVKCVGDDVVWILDKDKTSEAHSYSCSENGQIIRDSDKQVVGRFGEGCKKTCPVLAGVDPTLNFRPPTIYETPSGQRIADGDEYMFSCKPEYVYPTGSSPASTRMQKLKCDASTGNYVDSTTMAPVTQPQSCVRDPKNPECKKPDVPSNVEQKEFGCTQSIPGFVKAGCVIEYVCKKGYKPTDQSYIDNNKGVQKLECKPDGQGWKDNLGKTVTGPMVCTEGCIEQPESSKVERNSDTRVVISGEDGDIICYSTSKESNMTTMHPYMCERKNSTETDNYYESNCDNACKALKQPLPDGVVVVTQPALYRHEEGYHIIGSRYVLACDSGYTYEPESSYAKENAQTLLCDAMTTSWIDDKTGKPITEPAKCVKQPGCKNPVHPTAIVSKQSVGCVKTGDFYVGGCTISVECPDGYYPTIESVLYNSEGGKQDLECKITPNGPEWFDKHTNQVTNTSTECKPGCVKTEVEKIVFNHNESSTQRDLTYRPVSDSDGHSAMCVEEMVYNTIRSFILKISSKELHYFCQDSAWSNGTDMHLVPSAGCPDTCKQPNVNTGPTVEPVEKVPTVQYGGDVLIINDHTLRYKCVKGYQYSQSSRYAASGEQVFRCDKGEWTDTVTGKTVANGSIVVEPCEQVKTCEPLFNTETATITPDGECEQVDGRPAQGCKLRVQCKEGFRPTNTLYMSSPYQNLTCASDRGMPAWKDANTNGVAQPQVCEPGCQRASGFRESDRNNIKVGVGNTYVSCMRASEVTKSNPYLPFHCKDDGDGKNNMECSGLCYTLNVTDNLSTKLQPSVGAQESVRAILLTEAPYIAEKRYLIPGETVEISCQESGDAKLKSVGKTSTILKCEAGTLTYSWDDKGQKGLTSFSDECMLPPGCAAALNKTGYLTSPNAVWSSACAVQGDIAKTGCAVTLDCGEYAEYHHWHPHLLVNRDFRPRQVQWTCLADGTWQSKIFDEATRTYTSKSLPDVCQKLCRPTQHVRNETTTQGAMYSDDPTSGTGLRRQQISIDCQSTTVSLANGTSVRAYGIWVEDRRWADRVLYDCNYETDTWIEQRAKVTVPGTGGTITDSCVGRTPVCDPVQNTSSSTGSVSASCVNGAPSGPYQCTVAVECKEGYSIRRADDQKRAVYRFTCDEKYTLKNDNDTDITIDILDALCEKQECADPTVAASPNQQNEIQCNVDSATNEKKCDIKVTCGPGYVIRGKNDKSTDTFPFKCDPSADDEKYTGDGTTETLEAISDICVEQEDCDGPNIPSTDGQLTLKVCTNGTCKYTAMCNPNYSIKGDINSDTAQFDYKCNFATKELEPVGHDTLLSEVGDACQPNCKLRDLRNDTTTTITINCEYRNAVGFQCTVRPECKPGFVLLNIDKQTSATVQLQCRNDSKAYEGGTSTEIVPGEHLTCKPEDKCLPPVVKNTTAQTTTETCDESKKQCTVSVDCKPGYSIKTDINKDEVGLVYDCTEDKQLKPNNHSIPVTDVNDICVPNCQLTDLRNDTTVDINIKCSYVGGQGFNCQMMPVCKPGYVLTYFDKQTSTTIQIQCDNTSKPIIGGDSSNSLTPAELATCEPEPKCVPPVVKNTTAQTTTETCDESKKQCTVSVDCKSGYSIKTDINKDEVGLVFDCTEDKRLTPNNHSIPVTDVNGVCVPNCELTDLRNDTTVDINIKCSYVGGQGFNCQMVPLCKPGYVLTHFDKQTTKTIQIQCDNTSKPIIDGDSSNTLTPAELATCEPESKCVPPVVKNTTAQTTTETCDESKKQCTVSVDCKPGYSIKTDINKNKVGLVFDCTEDKQLTPNNHSIPVTGVNDVCVPNCELTDLRNDTTVDITIKCSYVDGHGFNCQMVPLCKPGYVLTHYDKQTTTTVQIQCDNTSKPIIGGDSSNSLTPGELATCEPEQKCVPPVVKNTTAQTTTETCDETKKQCTVSVKCEPGYSIKTDINKDEVGLVFDCTDDKQLKPNNHSIPVTDVNDVCVPNCELTDLRNDTTVDITIKCSYVDGHGFNCQMVPLCKPGYVLTHYDKQTTTTVQIQCDNTSKPIIGGDSSNSLTPGELATCEPESKCVPPVVKNTTAQTTTETCDETKKQCTVSVKCEPGYSIKTDINKDEVGLVFDCTDDKQLKPNNHSIPVTDVNGVCEPNCKLTDLKNDTTVDINIKCSYVNGLGFNCQMTPVCKPGYILTHFDKQTTTTIQLHCDNTSKPIIEGSSNDTLTPADLSKCEPEPNCVPPVVKNSTGQTTTVTCDEQTQSCTVVVACEDGFSIKTDINKHEVALVYNCTADKTLVPKNHSYPVTEVNDQCATNCKLVDLTNDTTVDIFTNCSYLGGAVGFHCVVIPQCKPGYVLKHKSTQTTTKIELECNATGKPIIGGDSHNSLDLVEATTCVPELCKVPQGLQNSTKQTTVTVCDEERAQCDIIVTCTDGHSLKTDINKDTVALVYDCTATDGLKPNNHTYPITGVNDLCARNCELDELTNTTIVDIFTNCSYSAGAVGYQCTIMPQCKPGYVLKHTSTVSTTIPVICNATGKPIIGGNSSSVLDLIEASECIPEPNCVPPAVKNSTGQTTTSSCDEATQSCTVVVDCKEGYSLKTDIYKHDEALVYNCTEEKGLVPKNHTVPVNEVNGQCVPTCSLETLKNTTNTNVNVTCRFIGIEGFDCQVTSTCKEGYVSKNTKYRTNVTIPVKCSSTAILEADGNSTTIAEFADMTECVKEVCDQPEDKDTPAQTTTVECSDVDAKCNVFVECKPGYSLKTNITKKSVTLVYECKSKDEPITPLNHTYPIEEAYDQCAKNCELDTLKNQTTNEITVSCSYVGVIGFHCIVQPTCQPGYILKHISDTSTTFNTTCDETGVPVVTGGSESSLTPAEMLECVEEVCTLPEVLNRTWQTSTVKCDQLTKQCDVSVKCADGYHIKDENQLTENVYAYECTTDKKHKPKNHTIPIENISDICETIGCEDIEEMVPNEKFLLTQMSMACTELKKTATLDMYANCTVTLTCKPGYVLFFTGTSSVTNYVWDCAANNSYVDHKGHNIVKTTEVCVPIETSPASTVATTTTAPTTTQVTTPGITTTEPPTTEAIHGCDDIITMIFLNGTHTFSKECLDSPFLTKFPKCVFSAGCQEGFVLFFTGTQSTTDSEWFCAANNTFVDNKGHNIAAMTDICVPVATTAAPPVLTTSAALNCVPPEAAESDAQKSTVTCTGTGEEMKCNVLVECKQEYAIRTDIAKTREAFAFKCTSDETMIPANHTQTIEEINDMCIPVCTLKDLKNTTESSVLVACKVESGVGYACTIIATCEPGNVLKWNSTETTTTIRVQCMPDHTLVDTTNGGPVNNLGERIECEPAPATTTLAPTTKKREDCVNLFENKTIEQYEDEKHVTVLNYTGYQDCENDRCVLHVTCKTDYSTREHFTERIYVCRDGNWRSKETNDIDSLSDCYCGLLSCCYNSSTIVFNNTASSRLERKNYTIDGKIYLFSCQTNVTTQVRQQIERSDMCYNDTTPQIIYDKSVSPCSGGCLAINTGYPKIVIEDDMCTGITPMHDNKTLDDFERFRAFGIHEPEDGLIIYGHGRGLRLYCDTNFNGMDTDTVDVVCDGETGKWMDRSNPSIAIWPGNLPGCPEPPKNVRDYECIPPELSAEYRIIKGNQCDASNGNIFCTLAAQCVNNPSKTQPFICTFDQGWHNFMRDVQTPHRRIEDDLDKC